MMEPERLAHILSDRFGLELCVDAVDHSADFYLRFSGIPSPNGFVIKIKHGWRRVDAIFCPDSFAGPLVRTMCSADGSRRSSFASMAGTFNSVGCSCLVKVDHQTCSFDALPDGNWSTLEISCSHFTDGIDLTTAYLNSSSACLALVLALLPVDEEYPLGESGSESEGMQFLYMATRYERSAANRAAAIAYHGSACAACSFDFSNFYGELGDGFIEIHHKQQLSQSGGSLVTDPVHGLVPLCANCHRMVHRQTPPLSVEQLKAIIARNKKS